MNLKRKANGMFRSLDRNRLGAMAAAILCLLSAGGPARGQAVPIKFEDYLRRSVVDKKTRDRNRYFIGHYSPAGNHFFAYAIKDTVIDWLDPKPITYQNRDDLWITFEGYLPK